MRVKARFKGYLARKIGEEIYLEFKDQVTLSEAVDSILKAGGLEKRGSILNSYRIFLNGKMAKMDTPLRDGDEIAFLPIIAGG